MSWQVFFWALDPYNCICPQEEIQCHVVTPNIVLFASQNCRTNKIQHQFSSRGDFYSWPRIGKGGAEHTGQLYSILGCGGYKQIYFKRNEEGCRRDMLIDWKNIHVFSGNESVFVVSLVTPFPVLLWFLQVIALAIGQLFWH